MTVRFDRIKRTTAWLGLCPLLAIATAWPVALTLAICLLLTIALTAFELVTLRHFVSQAVRLPLSVLLAGTLAVLEQLALAAWWPALDAAAAPWLALVAGLAVLVCCFDENLRDDRALAPAPLPTGEGFIRSMKFALMLSVALLMIGVARDGFGRVFLLAETPVGALVSLALLLAGINFVIRGSTESAQTLHRGDEQPRSAVGLRRNDEQP